MRHRHQHGRDGAAADAGDAPLHEGRRGRGFGGGRHGRRPFDYGELRLLALAMIAEQPRHGYELMKAIEERMGGSYTPSPGVMYPTLAWLEDMGYATVETEEAGRKRYRISTEGQAFLSANAAGIDALHARLGSAGKGPPPGVPAPILRGMENVKLALRLRMKRGPIDQEAAEKIAAALDAAAQAVERT
jgi:DNA-binding PadR family transcriptional regulator